MVEGLISGARFSCEGLTVEVAEGMQVATLRHLAADGPFAHAVRGCTGVALPAVLQVVEVSAEREAPATQMILAWRSPTETLCITRSAARLSQLQAAVAGAADGCFVDLTGGLEVVRVTGNRLAGLLCRLGGSRSLPPPGEARRSRLADVPVLAVSLRPEETFLVLDRVYLQHLLGWIRETLADFAAAEFSAT